LLNPLVFQSRLFVVELIEGLLLYKYIKLKMQHKIYFFGGNLYTKIYKKVVGFLLPMRAFMEVGVPSSLKKMRGGWGV